MPRPPRAQDTPVHPRLISTDRAIAALEDQARAWATRAVAMRVAIEHMREQIRKAERASELFQKSGAGRPRGFGRRAPRGLGVGSAAAEILKALGRPARVNEILAEFEKRGVRVGGKRPYATLAATLMKHKGVKRAGRGLFAAADGPVEAAPTTRKGRKRMKRVAK